MAGDSESVSTEPDVEGDNVAKDVNGKPVYVIGQSLSCLSVSTL